MQHVCPDILITNYSMLEYMLLRNRETSIWEKTQNWLIANPENKLLLSKDSDFDLGAFRNKLIEDLESLRDKRIAHPELYGPTESNDPDSAKSLLDALYEEGIIPTYSFPKNVVSTFIQDFNGKIEYQVERGLDVAIGEYAPGRAIVVDKGTYQIGGLYYQGSERKNGALKSPARSFVEDKNYLKDVITCEACGWFGLATDEVASCPFCGNRSLSEGRQMLRPWGFSPRNGNKMVLHGKLWDSSQATGRAR